MRLTSVSSAALFAAALWAAPVSAEEGEAADTHDPMTIVVSLPNQRATIYRGTSVVTTTAVSTGKRGHSTKAGVYSILEKRRRHYSNLYNGAPMPWMQRLTWSGTALHAGVVPGYPASHGCIRLPYSFAPKLFSMTEVGAQVVVAHSAVEPKPISHAALFQPLPPPMPPELLTQDAPAAKPLRRSSNETAPNRPFRLPVVFAKAATVAPRPAAGNAPTKLALVIPETTGSIPQVDKVETAHSLDDTTKHAIDPSAAPFVGSGSHAVAAKAPLKSGKDEAGDRIASVETTDDFMKHQDRLLDREDPKSADRLEPADEMTALDEPVTETNETQPQELESASLAPEAGEPSEIEARTDDPIGEVASLTDPASVPANDQAIGMVGGTIEAKAQQPVSLSLSVLGVNDHPPLPLERPSAMMSRLQGGTRSAAIEAAEPMSQEPLRILVTRRTERDRTVDVQYMLSDMGYLDRQNFDGTRGGATVQAIKAFQKDNELPVTGALSDDVVKKIYEVAGKTEPAEGQLFVRQKFASVFSTPVSFSDPDKPLGTHLFTVMHFEPGATQAEWTAISLNDEETADSVLNRIDIPADVRQRISERLTPGSSLIVADTAINSAALPKGADFLVWDTSRGASVQTVSTSPTRSVRKRSTAQRPSYTRERSASRYTTRRAPARRGFFQF